MFSTRIVACTLFASLTAVSLTATAQVGKSDSPTTQETASTVPYESVFSGYKGFRDPDLVSWKEANEQVADTSSAGGHDMSQMNGAAEGTDMSSMPGHDMSKMKKDEPRSARPAMGEGGKESKGMGDMSNMKGMNHGDMKNMNTNKPAEKDK